MIEVWSIWFQCPETDTNEQTTQLAKHLVATCRTDEMERKEIVGSVLSLQALNNNAYCYYGFVRLLISQSMSD